MKTLYLAHPRLIKYEGFQIQKRLEDIGFKVINPFVEVEQGLLMGEIVEKELSIIDNEIDGLVVVVDDVWTIGTTMEAFHAWEMDLPVFVLWLSKNSEKSWYNYIATRIFYDIESLVGGLKDE